MTKYEKILIVHAMGLLQEITGADFGISKEDIKESHKIAVEEGYDLDGAIDTTTEIVDNLKKDIFEVVQ